MRFQFLISIIFLLLAQHVSAGITVTGTRIIFPSNQQSVSIQLNNKLDKPALAQLWLDDGDPSLIPSADKIPFIITPPLSEISAKRGQMVRIIVKDKSQLPADRESLFWFNVLDIPSKHQDNTENTLQISIRTRLKLFYRPKNLVINQNQAFNLVKFKYDDLTGQVEVHNPSPYFLNFFDVVLVSNQDTKTYNQNLMLAPYATEKFNPEISFQPTQLKYQLINDYGVKQSYSILLK